MFQSQLNLLLPTRDSTRYIIVPEEKGSNLVCVSALGPAAGERISITHPAPNCPTSMAVDSCRHATGACAPNLLPCSLTYGCSDALVFAIGKKIFVTGGNPSVTC
jgi:hypothetical protein